MIRDAAQHVISECSWVICMVVHTTIYDELEAGNDLANLIHLRKEDRYMIKCQRELDMGDFTHDIEMHLGALKDVKSDIFTYGKQKGEDAVNQ